MARAAPRAIFERRLALLGARETRVLAQPAEHSVEYVLVRECRERIFDHGIVASSLDRPPRTIWRYSNVSPSAVGPDVPRIMHDNRRERSNEE